MDRGYKYCVVADTSARVWEPARRACCVPCSRVLRLHSRRACCVNARVVRVACTRTRRARAPPPGSTLCSVEYLKNCLRLQLYLPLLRDCGTECMSYFIILKKMIHVEV
uniref:Uncharacterized protein n=1 Tax=Pararge aegeria TaxID=116150 RepID=S4NQX7_9NEOP